MLLVRTFRRFSDEVRAAMGRQLQLHANETWFDQALQAHTRRVNRDYA